jgi:hypothetical protein
MRSLSLPVTPHVAEPVGDMEVVIGGDKGFAACWSWETGKGRWSVVVDCPSVSWPLVAKCSSVRRVVYCIVLCMAFGVWRVVWRIVFGVWCDLFGVCEYVCAFARSHPVFKAV